MKKYLLITFIFLLPFCYSCINTDDKPSTVSTPAGITAFNNGLKWEAILLDTISNDSLELYASSKVNILKLKFPVTASTTYQLLGNEGAFYIRNNQGIITKTFKLDYTYLNSVSVALNSTENIISGGFAMRFVIDPSVPGNDTTGLDTVTFTNGEYVVPAK